MSLPIITADQRLAERRGVKGVLVGKSGIGKTSQLWTLNPTSTLFFDLEAGDLAVEGYAGDTIRPRTWQECRDFAVFIGGANPALREDQPYSEAHFSAVCERFGDPVALDKYDTVFVDSITVAGRLCLQWCKGQPQAYSEKTGKPDNRGAYGLMGQEMIAWLTHLQHTRRKNVWFVGILNEALDDFNRRVFSLQIDGSKTGLELPGIVDEVITLAEVKADDGSSYRTFVCHTLNQWGYPAKDRSGRLDAIEEPNLGRLMQKIAGPARPATERLDFARPPVAADGARPTHTSIHYFFSGVLIMTFFDFNSAAEQANYDLIPKGTIARVRMTIKPGGYDDASQGWTGGFATCSQTTGSVYLNCEFVVLDGPFARRKMWSLIGLYSAKGAEWTNMGRTFIKAILNSARGINPSDNSPAAQNARRISGFADLEGIEFIGKVDWDKDQNGQDKCVIKSAITAEHKDYAAYVNGSAPSVSPAPGTPTVNAYAQATGRSPVPGRPSWAQ